MSSKRAAEDATPSQGGRHISKKQKRGFRVGPDNLPDGQWKRKNQQIKRDLISQAKLKKDYAKIKARQSAAEADVVDEAPAAATAPHPDRQGLIDREEDTLLEGEDVPEERDAAAQRRRQPRARPAPFAREQRAADETRAKAEARRVAREEGERQRKVRIEERERFRRAMAKARTGGRNGQRKLGRESAVLLGKVKRMVSNA